MGPGRSGGAPRRVEKGRAMTAPQHGTAGTAAAAAKGPGPASHVVVDVVDPGVGGATPVRQMIHSLGGQVEKPSTSPVLLLSGGIVVAATVVSAGVVNMTPTIAALIFATSVAVGLRVNAHRARRT